MKIAAVVSRGADTPLSVERVVLDDPRPDEILVRIVAAGVCHTDIVTRHYFPDGVPVVLGHEGAGVVAAVGSDVTSVGVGDKVILSYRSCGSCDPCAQGHPAYCARFAELNVSGGRGDGTSPLHGLDGSPITGGFFGQSSFAGYALTTAANTVRVPADTDLAVTASFGCGMQTGAGVVANVLRPGPSDSLVVFGTGAVGMAAIMAARALGVETIVGVDLSEQRLALARELGATRVVSGLADTLVEDLRAATGGGATHALDTTGNAGVISTATEALGPLGQLVLVGTGGAEFAVDSTAFIGAGKTVRGSIEGDADPHRFIPQLLRWHDEGLFPVERLVRTYHFDAVEDAIADSVAGTTIKPVLVFSETEGE